MHKANIASLLIIIVIIKPLCHLCFLFLFSYSIGWLPISAHLLCFSCCCCCCWHSLFGIGEYAQEDARGDHGAERDQAGIGVRSQLAVAVAALRLLAVAGVVVVV